MAANNTNAAAAAAKKPMGKTDLIDAVAKATNMEKTKAKAAVDAAIDAIVKELKRNGKVQLTGFGTFSTARRKKRMGVNPKTGAKITIPARKVPKFTPGKALKDAIS
jgi:nucleoid DNA-binding protein